MIQKMTLAEGFGRKDTAELRDPPPPLNSILRSF